MCLRVSPVVRYTGVCLVIWDDMLGIQNLPKQTRWCNSVWSALGASRHHSPAMSDPVLLCLQDGGNAEVFSLDDAIMSFFFELDLFFWLFTSHIHHMTKHGVLANAKQVRRERGGRVRVGEWHKESLSYLLKDEILSVQPGCNFLQQVQKGCGGGITPWLFLLFSKLHIAI